MNPLLEANRQALLKAQTMENKEKELPDRFVGSEIHDSGDIAKKNQSRAHYSSSNEQFSSSGDVDKHKKSGAHQSVACNETGDIKRHLANRAHYTVKPGEMGDLTTHRPGHAHHLVKGS